MPYWNYSTIDFVLDEDFQEWVLHPDPERTAFWENWLRQHPGKQPIVEQARTILLSVDFKKTNPADIDDKRMFERIQQMINHQSRWGEGENTPAPIDERPSADNLFILRNWQKVAASIVLLLGLSFLLYYTTQNSRYIEYQTDYGETQHILLPDSSMVVLNANSRLKILKNWENTQAREVWLEGEAFFEVKKNMINHDHLPPRLAPQQGQFIVHADYLDVFVLGTQFNVNNRRDKARVVLSSGRVQLRNNINHKVSDVMMQPGELAELSLEKGTIIKSLVDTNNHISWKENVLVFDELPLSRISEMIEDNFGVEIQFADTEFAKRKFKGAFPSDSLEVLIRAFSKAYNLETTREPHRIIFHKKNPEGS